MAQLAETLRYKPEGQGSILEGFIFNFTIIPSGRIVDLGYTQPLIEMSTRDVSWG
jgi:hypothetical protein